MRAFAGFLFLSAGLGVGAYTYDPSLFSSLASLTTGDNRISMARTGEPSMIAPAAHAATAEGGARTRVFSPQSPLFAPAIADARPAAPAATAPKPTAAAPATSVVVTAVVDGEAPSAPVTRPISDWATSVTSTTGAQRKSKPSDPEARADLVREIQTELKRVGCYDGEIDGSWGAGSKRAIGTFTERINATLPIEEPDYILLTLVQGHKTNACGEQCPTGQAMSEGRCVPRAVVAAAQRKARKGGDGAGAPIVTSSIAADTAKSEPAPARIVAETPVAVDAAAKSAPVRTIAEVIAAPAAVALAKAAEDKAAAERKAAVEQKLAAEQKAAAERKVAAEHKAAAERKVAAEQKAAAERRLAAELTAEQKAAEARERKPSDEQRVARADPQAPPLPGRMTIGGPVPERTQAAEPLTAPAPAATDDDDDEKPRHRRVTPHAPAPRAVHAPVPRAHAPRAVHTPPPRIVHTPPPPPRREVRQPQRIVSLPSSGGGSSAASRQRAMVYNLFQRPDRN